MERDGQGLDEPARLAALARTGLMDAPSDEGMQRISRLVSRLLRVPVALASFVDESRQFFVASTGFDVEPFATDRQTPLSHSFCQHVVLRGQPLRVTDARTDPLVQENLAIEDLGVIAYLGVPLRSPDGQLLGSLCAIDGEPREWSPEDAAALADLAGLVTDELSLRAASRENHRLTALLKDEIRRDPLTGLANRREWEERAHVELARARREDLAVAAVVIDLDGFKAVNDERGHLAGDELLARIGRRWRPMIREPDLLIRWGGDEFVLLLGDATPDAAHAVADRLAAAVEDLIEMTAGVAGWDGTETATDLIERADAALLTAKWERRSDSTMQ